MIKLNLYRNCDLDLADIQVVPVNQIVSRCLESVHQL